MIIPDCRLMIAIMALLAMGCSDSPAVEPEVQAAQNINRDFDFTNPGVVTLKKKLKEISGIVYIGNEQFASIEDETGIIFIINYTSGEIINTINFAGKGDYEDIAVDSDYYYVLESSGTIYRLSRSGQGEVSTYLLPGKKNREFESIYLDDVQKKFVMLCKECKGKDDVKEGYCFDPGMLTFQKHACFSLDFTKLEKKLPEGILLKPSAAAINPADQKLYVLCSVGKMLLRCTLNGQIEKAFPLDPAIFRQPEGLAFNPTGDMFISNEAAGEQATLVRIAAPGH